MFFYKTGRKKKKEKKNVHVTQNTVNEMFCLVLKLHLAWYRSMRHNITAIVIITNTAGII